VRDDLHADSERDKMDGKRRRHGGSEGGREGEGEGVPDANAQWVQFPSEAVRERLHRVFACAVGPHFEDGQRAENGGNVDNASLVFPKRQEEGRERITNMRTYFYLYTGSNHNTTKKRRTLPTYLPPSPPT